MDGLRILKSGFTKNKHKEMLRGKGVIFLLLKIASFCVFATSKPTDLGDNKDYSVWLGWSWDWELQHITKLIIDTSNTSNRVIKYIMLISIDIASCIVFTMKSWKYCYNGVLVVPSKWSHKGPPVTTLQEIPDSHIGVSSAITKSETLSSKCW